MVASGGVFRGLPLSMCCANHSVSFVDGLGVRAVTRTWPAAKPDAAETIAAFDATVVDTRARSAEVVLA